MTITDTGPIIAILNRNDRHHAVCRRALSTIRLPLVTTWPVITECMYFLGEIQGARGQQALWSMLRSGNLVIEELPATAQTFMADLMTKYLDLPMDLADASLCALCAEKRDYRVFTLDSDFSVYVLPKKQHLTPLP